LYRNPKDHEVETLELTPVAARIIDRNGGSESMTEIVRAAARQETVVVDVPFVDALSALLADFVERGVLLGSRPIVAQDDGAPAM
jgi:hypothetical protein